MSKKKMDFGALAARQVERDMASAAQPPDRFDRAQAALGSRSSSLEVDTILARQQSTRDIDEGHVKALAESIGALGLIEPIVIDTGNRLLAGGHRLEAIKRLRTDNPGDFGKWFSDGVPVRVMAFDAEASPARALEVEVAENEHRRDYTVRQIRELVGRLKDAGYRDTVGRPRAGEKALGPALEVIVGKSMKTIRKLLSDRVGEGDGKKKASEPSLGAVLRALARQRPFIPDGLLEQFDEVLRGLEELKDQQGQGVQ